MPYILRLEKILEPLFLKLEEAFTPLALFLRPYWVSFKEFIAPYANIARNQVCAAILSLKKFVTPYFEQLSEICVSFISWLKSNYQTYLERYVDNTKETVNLSVISISSTQSGHNTTSSSSDMYESLWSDMLILLIIKNVNCLFSWFCFKNKKDKCAKL